MDVYNVLDPLERKKSLKSLLEIISYSKKDFQIINTI